MEYLPNTGEMERKDELIIHTALPEQSNRACELYLQWEPMLVLDWRCDGYKLPRQQKQADPTGIAPQ
jgi:hypothetical protein